MKRTYLIAKYSVRFYHEQYKMHKTYPAGTKFTVIRYDKPFLSTSARVIAPGGLIGTVCLKSLPLADYQFKRIYQ